MHSSLYYIFTSNVLYLTFLLLSAEESNFFIELLLLEENCIML